MLKKKFDLKKYNDNPMVCPFCGGGRMVSDGFSDLSEEVHCKDCGEDWVNCYAFSGVYYNGIYSQNVTPDGGHEAQDD